MTNVITFTPRPVIRPENPRGSIHVCPDGQQGGCWAVHHMSRSGDSSALLSRHFSLNDAIAAAELVARKTGADLEDAEGGAA